MNTPKDERARPNLVILAADCPWKHDDQLGSRGAGANYDLMSVEELERMTLPQSFVRARNAVLFLWLLESMQLEAMRVALAWRCKPYASLVWEKTTQKGTPHFGMGRILRGSHERCLVAVRGDYKGGYEPAVKDVRTSFTAPMPVDERGKLIHSAKPDRFFELVERLYPGADSKHEMFSRRDRAGWLTYGRETGKLNNLNQSAAQ